MARRSASASLTGKLLFWVTLITAATLIAFVFAATSISKRVLQRQILRDASEAAEDIAFEIMTVRDPLQLIGETMWINKLLARFQMRRGIQGIQIEVTSDGRTGYLMHGVEGVLENHLIEFEEVPVGQLLARGAEARIEVALRQALRDGVVEVRVVASTEVITTFVDVIYRNSRWMGFGAWLGLLLTIALVIRRTVRTPLRRVAEGMEEVAVGHLGGQLEAVGTSEIQPLVASFNRMSRRLSSAERARTQLLDEVETLNDDLQLRIEDATAALSEAQADLARQDRLVAMGELVGTIAHEVGTPLNSVLAHLDLLDEDLPSEFERERLEIVSREIERVSSIIRRYLRSTRLPSPRYHPLELSDTIRDVLRIFEAQATRQGVSLEITSDAGAFTTDRDLLAQIMRNLVSNALKAVSREGVVAVSSALNADSLRLSVRDDGVGMDAEAQGQIFEPFYSTGEDGSGTGLGMSIVRNAVSALRGEIVIDSAVNEGTSVVVTLPRTTVSSDLDTGETADEGSAG